MSLGFHQAQEALITPPAVINGSDDDAVAEGVLAQGGELVLVAEPAGAAVVEGDVPAQTPLEAAMAEYEEAIGVYANKIATQLMQTAYQVRACFGDSVMVELRDREVLLMSEGRPPVCLYGQLSIGDPKADGPDRFALDAGVVQVFLERGGSPIPVGEWSFGPYTVDTEGRTEIEVLKLKSAQMKARDGLPEAILAGLYDRAACGVHAANTPPPRYPWRDLITPRG